MATTTASAFDEFHGRLLLTTNQKETVKGRGKRVAEYLSANFPSTSTLPVAFVKLIGSASRDTIIRPLNDIDVLATFQNKDDIFEKYRYDSKAFLYRVKDTLSAKTQIKKIGARGQAVRLFYNDDIHVDIAPVFRWNSGGFALPAGDGTWLTTDPFAQNDWLAERSKELGSHFKRRVRFLKRWNAVHSKRLESFHLEVMTGTVWKTISNNSREGLRNFFDWSRNYLSVMDPAGYVGDLSSYLTSQGRQDVVTSLESAVSRAENALSAEYGGDHEEAIRLWRLILGGDFPTFG